MPINHMPEHPGVTLQRDILPKVGTTIALAELIGIGRPNMSRILNGKSGISPRVALALESNGYGEARDWLLKQVDYDLAQERLNVRLQKALCPGEGKTGLIHKAVDHELHRRNQ